MLIVENDQQAGRECSIALQHLGYAPLISHSSAEALDIFARRPLSVAFIAYNLRDQGGLSLVQALSRTACTLNRSAHFVVMAGEVTLDIAVAAIRASAFDVLEKPLTPHAIRDVIRRISGIESKAMRRELLRRISDLGTELERVSRVLSAPLVSEQPNSAEYILHNEDRPPEAHELVAFIRRILRKEMQRRAIADGKLFGDPAWAMFLELMRSKLDGNRPVSVKGACIASGAPMSTALRLVRRLTDGGLITRIPDPNDRRRDFISLDFRIEEMMRSHLIDKFCAERAFG
ncbi:response regulator [Novosphingobium resinovorum]|uniref:response regulator n=1 Tax=Novosphingobium resinovorum TaxID=158500 RepID=UPI002ED493F2|nr:response regulator [Novosphingobium resinovorum]